MDQWSLVILALAALNLLSDWAGVLADKLALWLWANWFLALPVADWVVANGFAERFWGLGYLRMR